MYYAMSKDEPQGFAGPNDHWHYHRTRASSTTPTVRSTHRSARTPKRPPTCACKPAGRSCQQTQWMVHVWSVPGWESQQGLFGEVNPALTCPDGTYYQLPLEQWKDHPLNSCLSSTVKLALRTST